MHGPSPPSQSAGAEEILAPTVVRLDAHGRAVSQHTTVQKKQVAIDALPWAKWVELETPCCDKKLAKLLLETVVRQFHRHLMADPTVLPLPLLALVGSLCLITMKTKVLVVWGSGLVEGFSFTSPMGGHESVWSSWDELSKKIFHRQPLWQRALTRRTMARNHKPRKVV